MESSRVKHIPFHIQRGRHVTIAAAEQFPDQDIFRTSAPTIFPSPEAFCANSSSSSCCCCCYLFGSPVLCIPIHERFRESHDDPAGIKSGGMALCKSNSFQKRLEGTLSWLAHLHTLDTHTHTDQTDRQPPFTHLVMYCSRTGFCRTNEAASISPNSEVEYRAPDQPYTCRWPPGSGRSYGIPATFLHT